MVLAIDSSGLSASVAVVHNGKVLSEFSINYQKTHSQVLMPMIADMLKNLEIEIKDIDKFAVSIGPGSFTGLRIGVSLAKGFAYALKKNIIPVSTLDALAYNVFDGQCIVCPIMDARRGEVYTAVYRCEHKLIKLTDYNAIPINEAIANAEKLSDGKKIIFVGDGVAVHESAITEQCASFELASAGKMYQSAASVGLLAELDETEYADVNPFYLRKSEAERTWEKRNA